MARKQTGPAAKKSLGQHFLEDKGAVEAALGMAEVGPDDLIVEIGPGKGILTAALLAKASRVVAIEVDPRMVKYLQAKLSAPRLRIIQEDVLQVDWQRLFKDEAPVKVVANLPYYITSPIIQRLLAERTLFQSLVLMVQREVAERISAEPGGRSYGILSVAVQYLAQVELGLVIPPAAFSPPPEVYSQLIKLVPRPRPLVDAPSALFFRIVRAAFRQRRKTVLNALLAANLLDCAEKAEQKEKLAQILAAVDLSASQRPETISILKYGELTSALGPHLRQDLLSREAGLEK